MRFGQKSAGGTGSDQSFGIATDPTGNILVTGNFVSSSITFGSTTLNNAGSNDIFVAKLAASSTLPITMLALQGESINSVNRLTWSTATETDNTGFEIQRSADGNNFTALAFVNSKAMNGNSNSVLNYQFSDINPFSGNTYYRLKQIDMDGRFTYSNVIVIKAGRQDLLSFYPNPVIDQMTVRNNNNKSLGTMLIYDMNGKLMYKNSTGNTQTTIDLRNFSAGIYFLKTDQFQTTIKFMKQ